MLSWNKKGLDTTSLSLLYLFQRWIYRRTSSGTGAGRGSSDHFGGALLLNHELPEQAIKVFGECRPF